MTIYAIGDIQGCYADLQNLLSKINFSATNDTLWFAGDLVNRGPNSLETLRFIKSLGNSAITVLGNHDLHALAVRAGIKKDKKGSLSSLLSAPDADELFDWLRNQPLIHYDVTSNFTLVHAGIPAEWDLKSALNYGDELHKVLSDDSYVDFLEHMYGDIPNLWSEQLLSWDRLRYICNAFTRMRFCYDNGQLNFSEKNSPEYVTNNSNEALIPWFELENRKTQSDKIIFGHWSNLGLRIEQNIFALDTGCLWGKQLTALKIDNKLEYYQVNCPKNSH
ncbi:Bis(5'-nucleosyl)-tetraphosphatase, symmetrical [hydrothermal vent metagenome]|uniref:bis(5'-nucleosyl)-tetraphosphatase (symmetrical) n=1 Tax=hydrothermal vent metagenome TaxID=652676 RepID=A0A3B1A6E2_9ZZZZ